jgi:hypothetical protein
MACAAFEKKADQRPPLKVVTEFYDGIKSGSMFPLSHDFNEIALRNAEICQMDKTYGTCGLNIYLNVPVAALKDDFKLTNFIAAESYPAGTVDISFKIMGYNRKIRYLLIQEDGQWVANDIFHNGVSIRKKMNDDVTYYFLKK